MGQKAVQQTLLTQDLGLDDILKVSDEDLRAGGYEPPQSDVEITHPRRLPEGIVPDHERLPHKMYVTFFDRIDSGQATEFARRIKSVVKGMEDIASC